MTKTIKPRFVLERELHAANERIKELEANSLLQKYMHAGLSCPIEAPDFRPRAASESGLSAFDRLAPILSFGRTVYVDDVTTADDTRTPEWDVQDPMSAWSAGPQEAEATGVEDEPATDWRDEPATDWRNEPATDWRDEPAADSGDRPAAYWADEHLPIRRTRSVPTWLPSTFPPPEYEEPTVRGYEDLTDSEYDDYHTDGEREDPIDPEAEGPTDPEPEETVDPEPERSGTLEDSLVYARNASDWCPECERKIRMGDDGSPLSLKSRSRLDDDYFYTDCRTCGGSASTVCAMPYKDQMRMMNRAHRIAQETVWNALRCHFPEWHNANYPEHPSEVRFGRSELEAVFDDVGRYSSSFGSDCSKGLYWSMISIVPLRNAVCHMGRFNAKTIDDYLKLVQSLAIDICDEPRTMKLRALRDELQRISEHALADIKARAPLAALPYAAPWALHHQRTFKWACEAYDDYQMGWHNARGLMYAKYPAFVISAALHWRGRAFRLGTMGPDYQERLWAARAKPPPVLITAPSVAGHSQPYYGDWREDLRRWFVVTKMEEKKPCDDPFHSDLDIAVLFQEADSTDDNVVNPPGWPVWPGSVDTSNAPALDGWDAPILPAPVHTTDVAALDPWSGLPILPGSANITNVTDAEGDDTGRSTEPDAPDALVGESDTADSSELSAPVVDGANPADDAEPDAPEVGSDSANSTQPDAPKLGGRADSTELDIPEVGAGENADGTELDAPEVEGANPADDVEPDASEVGSDNSADSIQPRVLHVEDGADRTELDVPEVPAGEIVGNHEPDALEVFLVWTLLVELFILTIQSCMYR
ncbi:hypothetical protein LTR33_011341 [Friedmanniomyces endolithicus]|nr:hypothetical protein LTR33_011341 [Friedmanniomyces endolithicus]